MGMGAKSREKIIDSVADLDNFAVGNVRGGWYPDGTGPTLGKLPPERHSSLRHCVDPVYVVHSYATPIAWREAGKTWQCPPVRYSRTTSGHLSVVRQGMDRWDERSQQAAESVFIDG